MPTSLEAIRQKLKQRILVLDSAFDRHLIEPVVVQRVDKFALQEGYVSALWQTWCSFCRDLLICSAQGAVTRAGNTTTSPFFGRSEMENAFVAKQLSQNNHVNAIRPLVGSHQEHTWGDLSKMNLVASGIGCSNSGEIFSGLSACLRIEDLQLCRNASAHISRSTIHGVRTARVRYQDTAFRHPTDMMMWVDPNSSDFLWKSWIDEIDLASELSIL